MCEPKCMAHKVRKSRKIHICCECGKKIGKGDKYHYTSGVWEQPDSFKQCYLCGYLFIAASNIHLETSSFAEFGPMYEFLGDWINTFRENHGKTGKETLKQRANRLMEADSG